jgi:hypothetical protein
MVKKPLAKLVDKKTGKAVDPKRIMPIIFNGLRRSYPAYASMDSVMGEQFTNDVMFSKITANYKELLKTHGDGFKEAYDAYKNGTGAKARKEMAKSIKGKYLDNKQIELNKRIDELLKNSGVEEANPQPKNPYMKFVDGEWIDYSPKALAERIKDERDKAVKELKDKEAKNALKDIAELTLRIQRSNQQLMKPFNQLKQTADEFKRRLNPFAFGQSYTGGGLLNIKPKQPTLLGSTIQRTAIPKIKPDGSKRRAITGTGLSSYMERHKLTNPVDIAKTFLTKKGKDYVITGFGNLRFLCEQMNVNPEEALLYICEGMTDTKARWRNHRLDKEFWRGSQSVVNLVKYYNEQVASSKANPSRMTFTIKKLWNSTYCKDIFTEYGVVLPDYTQFSKWFKKMRHHVDVLKLDKPKKIN